jgi:hypothetical protein
MVLNAPFNNISVILWRSVLLVEETGVLGENHRPVATNWQTLSHKVVSPELDSSIGSCKSNYHAITTTKSPLYNGINSISHTLTSINTYISPDATVMGLFNCISQCSVSTGLSFFASGQGIGLLKSKIIKQLLMYKQKCFVLPLNGKHSRQTL